MQCARQAAARRLRRAHLFEQRLDVLAVAAGLEVDAKRLAQHALDGLGVLANDGGGQLVQRLQDEGDERAVGALGGGVAERRVMMPREKARM